MKYTCQPTENSLDELGIPKKPYFDSSHASIDSFHSSYLSPPWKSNQLHSYKVVFFSVAVSLLDQIFEYICQSTFAVPEQIWMKVLTEI